GTKKMSKSGDSDMERINMLDDADKIAKKFKKAKTDPEGLPETVAGLEGRPEAKNLVDIYAGLNDMTPDAVIAEYAGAQWGRFKPALAELAVAKLAPISDEMKRLMDDPAEIDRKLARGAEKARTIATPILEKTYDIVGLLRS
ncbi:MAG TPA: tryptophan--tRNA ligase, partial [Octadecabacter sp.]|nr:tryptophan--tRNA ligase [Octadecabacter sp.]